MGTLTCANDEKLDELVGLITTIEPGDLGSFHLLMDSAKSPIEKWLLAALIINFEGEVSVNPDDENDVGGRLRVVSGDGSELYCYVYPQFRKDGKVIDFLIAADDDRDILSLAIEVDGHDFHERTKEQAAKDRSRDRWLLKRGYLPVRFTGSEVYRDPIGCAREIGEIIHTKRWHKKEGC